MAAPQTTTTRKPAARKPAVRKPSTVTAAPAEAVEPAELTLADFEAWTDEAEEAALEGLINAFKYIVVEGTFVGRFSNGDIVRIPLEFNMEAFEGLDDSAAPLDQLRAVLVAVGDEAAADLVMSKPTVQAATCAVTYFELLQRITEQSIQRLQRTRLGE